MDETPEPIETPAQTPSSFMHRYRLYLLGAAVLLLLILFVLLGLQIGRMQKDFDRKALEQRIATMKKRLQESQEIIETARGELAKRADDAAEKEAQLARQAEEIAAHEQRLQACAASLSAAEQLLRPPPASLPVSAKPTPRPYLRFRNSECTLVPGKGEQSWRDCIEEAKGRSRSVPASAPQK